MATEMIQGGHASRPASSYGVETPSPAGGTAVDSAETGILDGVRYVKDALAARQGGLSDAELNALSHLITQLAAAFDVEQAFAANVTSFEQLERSLEALEQLLEEVDKAKAEMQQGKWKMIAAEVASLALGGLGAAKSLCTAMKQYQFNSFSSKAQSDLRSRGAGDLAQTQTASPSLDHPQMSPLPTKQNGPPVAPPNDTSVGRPASDGKQQATTRETEKQAATQETEKQVTTQEAKESDPFKDKPSLEKLNAKNLEAETPETVRRLDDYASARARKLGYQFEIEMHGARLAQQFAKSFSVLGETQQSIANIDLNADTNVYSNQTEYWSVLMGVYQRLAQEYQTAFQQRLGDLSGDVSQATSLGQYIYRS